MNNETDNDEKTTDQPLQLSALLCCPFCGSGSISSGEILGQKLSGEYFSQTACLDCGAAGSEVVCNDATDIRLRIECDELWNTRTTKLLN